MIRVLLCEGKPHNAPTSLSVIGRQLSLCGDGLVSSSGERRLYRAIAALPLPSTAAQLKQVRSFFAAGGPGQAAPQVCSVPSSTLSACFTPRSS